MIRSWAKRLSSAVVVILTVSTETVASDRSAANFLAQDGADLGAYVRHQTAPASRKAPSAAERALRTSASVPAR